MRITIEAITAQRLAAIAEDIAKTFRDGGEEALKRDFGACGAFYGSGAWAHLVDEPLFAAGAISRDRMGGSPVRCCCGATG